MNYMQNDSEIITNEKLLTGYVAKLKKIAVIGRQEALLDALEDSRYPRTLIVLRGKENEYIKLLYLLFTRLLSFYSSQELLKFFHERNISEMVFIQMSTVFFQMRDKGRHDQVLGSIFENDDLFESKAITAEALHAQGSWENAITKDYQKSLKLNKKALALCRKNGLKLLETKILYGLTHNKSLDSTIHLKTSSQIKDYQIYYKKFSVLNDEYHALRALIESYSLRIDLSLHDTKKNHKEIETVHQALLDLLHEQKKANNYYLIMFIKRELSKALMALGQEKKAQQYEKEYQKLKEGFSV